MTGDDSQAKDGKGKKGKKRTKKDPKDGTKPRREDETRDVDKSKNRGGGGGGKKDAELEAVEMKRRAILLRTKWTSQVSQLNMEVTMAIQRSSAYADAEESLGGRHVCVLLRFV